MNLCPLTNKFNERLRVRRKNVIRLINYIDWSTRSDRRALMVISDGARSWTIRKSSISSFQNCIGRVF